MPPLPDVELFPHALHLDQAIVAAIHPDEVPDCEWNDGGPIVTVVLEGQMNDAPIRLPCLFPINIATHVAARLVEIAYYYDPEFPRVKVDRYLAETSSEEVDER